MLGATAVYLGLLVALAGGVALLGKRPRRPGLGTVAAGGLVLLLGFLVPAPERRVDSARSRLDDFAPAYQFHEAHGTRVSAACSEAYRAVKEVTASEITFFRTLTWIRRFGRQGPESILDAPERAPLLEVATRTGFLALADDLHREVVIGAVVLAPPDLPAPPATADEFTALTRPGVAKAAMNFRLEDEPAGGCRVTTETRVFATDASARQRFAAYWRVIYPGSALIRRMWLRAVKRRAERSG
jgi:hypothetical protein